MVANVTAQGLIIPRRLLRGIKRAKIERRKNRITVVPAKEADPIRELGRKPVSCGLPDASAKHDQHLYGASA